LEPNNDIDPIDAIIRHQVYLEGYKKGESDDANKFFDEMMTIIIALMIRFGRTNFGDLTKKELRILLINITSNYNKTTAKYNSNFIRNMKKFFAVDFDMQRFMLNMFSTNKYSGPTQSKVWATVYNRPAPGIGLEPSRIVKTYFSSTLSNVIKTIKQAYAENWTIDQTARTFTGTKVNNYKDGIFAGLKRQLTTAIDTFIHSLSSYISYFIGSKIYEKYQWVSILDNRTTHICRSRDGAIYEYGKGPIPPAHYNCRSSIIPVFEGATSDMPTWYKWMMRQPKIIQDDMMGTARAGRFRNGTAEDAPGFDGTKTLTLEQFKAKRDLILTQT